MAEQANGHSVTEDEAALYDRQIRLWGLEAQNRIRQAHILVVNLDGLTTEAIKNWVLAGISTLTVADTRETTQWHDLSAGFFWRGEDVGQKRLPAATARIQALNPLVKINVLTPAESKEILEPSSARLASLKPNVMIVGTPSGPAGFSREWSRSSLEALNDDCRKLSIFFYCTGTLGLNGWIFSDLGNEYHYVVEKPDLNAALPNSTGTQADGASSTVNISSSSSASTGLKEGSTQAPAAAAAAAPATAPAPVASSSKKLEKRRQRFAPLKTAAAMSWKGLTRAQRRRNRPSPGLFAVWAIWDLVEEKLSSSESSVDITFSSSELSKRAAKVVQDRDAHESVTFEAQGGADTYFTALETSIKHSGEFSPSCAILGGVLSQDVLNALGGREEPMVNWFQLDGLTGAGPIHALATSPSTVVSRDEAQEQSM